MGDGANRRNSIDSSGKRVHICSMVNEQIMKKKSKYRRAGLTFLYHIVHLKKKSFFFSYELHFLSGEKVREGKAWSLSLLGADLQSSSSSG